MTNLKFRLFDKRIPKAHPAPNKFLYSDNCSLDVFFRWVKEYDLLDEVEQSSGRRDRMNKEIYVGDIVEFELERGETVRRKVVFSNKGYFGLSRDLPNSLPDTVPPALLYPFSSQCIVVGNIHEHPELLDPNTVYNLEGKPIAYYG